MPASPDCFAPESADFSAPESAGVSVLVSDALLASLALLAAFFVDADGLVAAALAVDDALDFAAPTLLLFWLTVLLPLIVFAIRGVIQLVPALCRKKECASQSLFSRSDLVVSPLGRAMAVDGLQPRTAINRMPEITIRVCENVIKSIEYKIGGPQ